MPSPIPPYADVTLFGATGFVGQLTAKALVKELPAHFNLTLAGRNEQKLAALVAQLPSGGPTVATTVADATSTADMHRLAGSARVVISTAGPYAEFGLPLVKACAEQGTHYADLTAEMVFIRASIETNHKTGQESGAQIVHACGFDSIPSDVGVFETLTAAHEAAEVIEQVVGQFRNLSGGLSGGTAASLVGEAAAGKMDANVRRIQTDPFCLAQNAYQWSSRGANPDVFAPFEGDEGHWLAPFFMGAGNARVVRRALSLLHDPATCPVVYQETMSLGTGVVGAAKAAGMSAGVGAATAALKTNLGLKVVRKISPERGQGPKSAITNTGSFELHTFGHAASGSIFRTVISGTGDPGYVGTALMLAACGVLLAQGTGAGSSGWAGGGVLTPSVAFGSALAPALRKHGFSVTTEKL